MASKYVEVSREGKDLRIQIVITDLNVERLSKAFKVDPATIFLKEEFGEKSYWPNEAGRFTMPNQETADSLPSIPSLLVMGEEKCSSTATTSTSAASDSSNSFGTAQGFSYTGTSNTNSPAGLSLANPFAPSTSGIRSSALFSNSSRRRCSLVKVIHAVQLGKGQFRELDQTYINVSQETANVNFVLSKAKECFGDDSLDLVTSNGLPVRDHDGTRGLSFWKCGSRKLYAIGQITQQTPPGEKGKRACTMNKRYKEDVSDESDSEAELKKPRTSHDVKELTKEVVEMKEMLSKVLSVNESLSLPISVVALIKGNFMCKICRHTPMIPPVIATTCCHSLLGCEECVNKWYDGAQGLTKKCPHCNESRGYAHTFQFKGIDDFLSGMEKTIGGENAQQ